MKYAVNVESYFGIKSDDRPAVGELIIPYKGQLGTFEAIADAVEKGCKASIVVPRSPFDKDFEAVVRDLNEIATVYKDKVSFQLPIPSRNLMRRVPGCYLSYTYAAGTFQEAVSLIHTGASEIYVTGSLAASTRKLKILADHVKIRMIPNVVQTNAYMFGNPGQIDPLQCFWVRPEGIKHYDGIVDTVEFLFTDKEREAALVHFYNEQFFIGKLGIIIHDHTKKLSRIDSVYDNRLDEYKSYCGLKCQMGLGKCNACQTIPSVSDTIRQAESENRIVGFVHKFGN